MLDNTVNKKEEEFYYNVLMGEICNVFSPFEISKDIDFPKKQELGGVVLKFIGSGAAYIKVQNEMPTEEELNSIYEVGKFLRESFGGYTVIKVLCMPHIEIRDINVIADETIDVDFISQRKNDGDMILDSLTKKLEANKDFTVEDHIQRIMVPFMGRKDNLEFEEKYSKFLKLYTESNMELPELNQLSESHMQYKRWY